MRYCSIDYYSWLAASQVKLAKGFDDIGKIRQRNLKFSLSYALIKLVKSTW